MRRAVSPERLNLTIALMAMTILIGTTPCFSQVVINEVLYDPAGTDTGLEFVELVNNGGSAVSLEGYELKLADSDYYVFTAVTINPGGRILIHNNASGTDTETEFYTGPLGNMGNTHGSVALFSGAHQASNIVDFVQYGSGGEQWESAAVGAGIWIEDDYVPDVSEGYSINLFPDSEDNDSSADWSECDPSPLTENCTVPSPTATPTVPPTTPPTPSPTITPTMPPSPTPSNSMTPTPSPSITPTSPPPTATPSPSCPVVINEILYDPEGTDTALEWIELLNTGSLPVVLTGFDLKPDNATYYSFPDFTLPANGRVVVHINAVGTDTDTELYAGTSSNMGNTSGSVVLFSSNTHSQETIVDFVEYGAGGQTWESTAVAAGIWTAGTFAPDAEEGDSINLYPDGVDTNQADDWSPCYPSFLLPNCDTTPPTETPAPGTPTATPTGSATTPTPTQGPTETPTPRQGVVINEILYNPEGSDTGNEFVELFNNSMTPIQLAGYDLKADNASYFTFPDFVLDAESYVTVHINASGENTTTDLYTGPTDNMGNSDGFCVLFNSDTHSSSTIVDYIEYGAGGQTWESAAVNAGIWREGDFAPPAEEGASINLCPNGADMDMGSNWYSDDPSAGMENPCHPPPPTPTPTHTQGPSPTPTMSPTPRPTIEPVIQLAGYANTSYRLDTGGIITLIAWITDPEDDVQSVQVFYGGEPIMEMYDDGLHGDFQENDHFYGMQIDVPPCPSCGDGTMRLLLRISAIDTKGYTSGTWPFLTVSNSWMTSTYSVSCSVSHQWWEYMPEIGITDSGSETRPYIYAAGYMDTRIDSERGGNFTLVAVVTGPDVSEVELYYEGFPTGVFLKDDGMNGDFGAGDGVFGLQFDIQGADLLPGEYFFQLRARNIYGEESDLWPYLTLQER